MANQLSSSSSLYLRQHAEQPVNWRPWGKEAFALARTLDRPIFLSIGYSACHWCHVMAHESFDDPSVAHVLNEAFISIKVDRQEHPDIDDLYMTATQLANGHGGWPMTLFLNHDLHPFFAGTYFPRDTIPGRIGFLELAQKIAGSWVSSRATIEESAQEFQTAIASYMERVPEGYSGPLEARHIDDFVNHMWDRFDAGRGGFGGAPKFPPHAVLSALTAIFYSDRPTLAAETRLRAGEIVDKTVLAMTRGGIYDHVGGGLHRYSTDADWHLPHFEKMLSDNALFMSQLRWSLRVDIDDEPLPSTDISHIYNLHKGSLSLNFQVEPGLYGSSIDADSEGKEGDYYTWEYDELSDLLDLQPSALAAYGCLPEGNYEDEASRRPSGRNILHHLPNYPPLTDAERMSLLAARSQRVPPSRDHQAIASWNAMVYQSLDMAEARIGVNAWKAWYEKLGYLPHLIADGQPEGKAFLDDLVEMARAASDLGVVERDDEMKAWSDQLLADIKREFSDQNGGFYYSAPHHGTPIGAHQPWLDGATPSPLARLAKLFVYRSKDPTLNALLRRAMPWMLAAPEATASWYEILEQVLQVSVDYVAPGESPELRAGGWGMIDARQPGRLKVRLFPGHTLNPEINGGNIKIVSPTNLVATLEEQFQEGANQHYVYRTNAAETGPIVVELNLCSEVCCYPPVEISVTFGSSEIETTRAQTPDDA